MNKEDERLMQVYMRGWHDELDGKFTQQPEPILIKAYHTGRRDALVGDECESLDYESTSSILSRIKDI